MMSRVILAIFALAGATADAVTPVEKVITLLDKLKVQIEEEGKVEAAAYDKYACFCKDQADEKEYAIGRSDKKIAELEAEVKLQGAGIAELDADVTAAKKTVEGERKEAETATSGQLKVDASYASKVADLKEGVKQIEGAIAALKASRSEVEAKTALLSLRAAVSRRSLTSGSFGPVESLLAAADGAAGAPAAAPYSGPTKTYEFKSNDVISVLEGLKKTFKEELAQTEEEASTNRHDFNMIEGARANKISSLEHEADEKATASALKSQKMAEAQASLDEEKADRDADQAFLDELTSTCEAKAKAWDERSKTRADELVALNQATDILKDEVADKYDANEKLTGLIQHKATDRQEPSGHWVWVANGPTGQHEGTPDAPQLVQLGRHQHHHTHASLRRAIASFLSRRAHALQSHRLSELVRRIEVSDDHFVKVRALIKDLIAQLEAQASEEATQKSFCDKEMGAAVDKRDKYQAEIESKTASIDQTETEIAKLEEDIETLSKELAELHKALKEMEELRAAEKEHNMKVVSDAEEGGEAVKEAIKILKDFYEGSLLETGYVPPNADREGNSVGDLAPETFEGEYKGKVESSKGIIGILEVIASDFERTSTTVEAAEDEAQAAFEKAKSEMEADISTKKQAKKEAEGELETKNADLVELKDGLKDSEKMHGQALKELEKLKPACTDAAESYEQRKAAREQEIEALKEALTILENWKD